MFDRAMDETLAEMARSEIETGAARRHNGQWRDLCRLVGKHTRGLRRAERERQEQRPEIGARAAWEEEQHPRAPAGSPEGGQFTEDGETGGGGGLDEPGTTKTDAPKTDAPKTDVAYGDRVAFEAKTTPKTTQPPSSVTPSEATKQAQASVEAWIESHEKAGVDPLDGNDDHPLMISTRRPTGVTATENPNEDYLRPDVEAMRGDAENFKKDMALFKNGVDYPGLRPDETKGKKPEEIARAVIDRVKSNLKFLYENMPTEIRDRAALWYVGGRRMVDERRSNTATTMRRSRACTQH